MKRSLTVSAVLGLSLLAFVFTGAAFAAPRTIQFEEVEKDSTFAFVDNAPKSELHHGVPSTISAGDQISISTPLYKGANKIGRLATTCTATVTAKSFDNAGFLCLGTFNLGKNTLVASAMISRNGGTEGAIIGGTGTFAGARGTFVSKEGGGRSKVTVTLLE